MTWGQDSPATATALLFCVLLSLDIFTIAAPSAARTGVAALGSAVAALTSASCPAKSGAAMRFLAVCLILPPGALGISGLLCFFL